MIITTTLIYFKVHLYETLERLKAQAQATGPGPGQLRRRLHPVSITRFPLTRLSAGSALLRNLFFICSG